jgi:hypothetical protein
MDWEKACPYGTDNFLLKKWASDLNKPPYIGRFNGVDAKKHMYKTENSLAGRPVCLPSSPAAPTE